MQKNYLNYKQIIKSMMQQTLLTLKVDFKDYTNKLIK